MNRDFPHKFYTDYRRTKPKALPTLGQHAIS